MEMKSSLNKPVPQVLLPLAIRRVRYAHQSLRCAQRTLTTFALIFLFSFAQGTQAQGLGRLFTTPAERARLEALRHAPPVVETPEVTEEPEEIVEEPEPVVVPTVTVNGYVIRSDGNNTAWVNGQSILHGDLDPERIRVNPRGIQGGSVSVQLPEARRAVRLKPGETYEPSVSGIVDSYQKPARSAETPAANP